MQISRAEVESVCTLAGIKIEKTWELMNQYWPRTYHELIIENPWWLLQTKYGLIIVGARKRVVEFSWEDAGMRGKVTADGVTSQDWFVHAYSLIDLAKYMNTWREMCETHALQSRKRLVDSVTSTILGDH